MKAIIKASTAKGNIKIISSKSYAHRLLIASALTNNDSIIDNIDLNNDILATINCLKTLGNDIVVKFNQIIIKKTNRKLADKLVFDCLESGSTLRFFIPIALTTGKKVMFRGTEKLLSRGLEPYLDICNKQKIKYTIEKGQISFEGVLTSGKYELPGDISSQFVTGLLFALPLLRGNSKILLTTPLQSKNYIEITKDVLNKAGIKIINESRTYLIQGEQTYHLVKSSVEGDYSNAAFFDALNYFNGTVQIDGLNKCSYQGDKIYQNYFELLNEGYAYLDLQNCIDLGPILFCFAAMKHGATFSNTKRLKIKESNRISELALELKKFGCDLVEYDNEVVINKEILHSPDECLYGHNDHRIVMSLAIMCTIFGGKLEGIESVNKSYPSFFKDLETLGIEVEYES